MVRTQISLTEEQWEGLRARAAKEGTSMAALIRAAVDRVLGEDSDERWRLALDAVGSGRSGVGGVSGRHDLHLVDAFDG